MKLKTHMSKVIILVYFFTICVYASSSQETQDGYIQKKIKIMMNTYHIPGVAVELYVNGELFEYYRGNANREKKDPIIRKTIFELGSMSSIMTSLLFAQEIDWAKMSLTDPVTHYVKDLPSSFNKITLVNLATQTAGLPTHPHSSFNINKQEDLMQYLAHCLPIAAPGQQWALSNLSIELLGEALSQSTEKKFDDLYHRHVLNPLQMVNGVIIPKAIMRYYAQGYDRYDNAIAQSMTSLWPASDGIKASALDMQKFLRAAIGLPGTPIRIFYPMRMTQSVYSKAGNHYQGLGWEVHKIENKKDIAKLLSNLEYLDTEPVKLQEVYDHAIFDGNALIDKSGIAAGFHSYIAVLPNKKSGIVMLVNKKIPDSVLVQAAREILFKVLTITPLGA